MHDGFFRYFNFLHCMPHVIHRLHAINHEWLPTTRNPDTHSTVHKQGAFMLRAFNDTTTSAISGHSSKVHICGRYRETFPTPRHLFGKFKSLSEVRLSPKNDRKLGLPMRPLS